MAPKRVERATSPVMTRGAKESSPMLMREAAPVAVEEELALPVPVEEAPEAVRVAEPLPAEAVLTVSEPAS